MSNIKPTTHWVLSQWGCYNHHLVLINNRLLYNFGLGLMGNKKWSHLLSSEKKGVWALRRKKNMTRGLICISSKLPGWMKTSTCWGSRTHLFQELGWQRRQSSILLPTKSNIPWNMQKSDHHYSLLPAWKPHWKIQPIDTGCGQMMKIEIGAAMETWLEEENMQSQ